MHTSNWTIKIKQFRLTKGLTQEQLAELSGLSLRTIQRFESGEIIPRRESLNRLSVALQVSKEEISESNLTEDKNFVTLIILSQLGFLVFPMGGIVLPGLIWMLWKEKDAKLNEVGKSVLNFQITWAIAFLIIFIGAMVRFALPIRLPVSIFGIIGFIGLYFYNLVFIVINFVNHQNGKKMVFKPTLTILR